MLASRAFEHIRALKQVRALDLQLPAVICLRADNRNPPITLVIRKSMLNRGPNLGGKLRVSQMRHRHQNRHIPKPHSSELPILYEESVSGNPPRTARATPQKTKSAATIPYAALLSARTPRKRNDPLRPAGLRSNRRLPRS